MAIDSTSPRSRRALLAAAAGVVAATAAEAVVRPLPMSAATGGNFILGQANAANAETALNGSDANYDNAVLSVSGLTGRTIEAANTATVPFDVGGNAIVGTSSNGIGVVGEGVRAGVAGNASGSGAGVAGSNGYSGPGILGQTFGPGSSPAIIGQSYSAGAGAGVYGVSRQGSTDYPTPPTNVGVAGWSPAGSGAQGLSDTGVGLLAQSSGGYVAAQAFAGAGTPPAPAPVTLTLPTGTYGEAAGASPTGVWGQGGTVSTGSSTGVYGEGDTGVWGFGGWGVFGASDATGTGVYGFSGASVPAAPVHTGVFGYSDSGTGVYAKAATGTALYVVGKARFSRSGRSTIGSGKSSLVVYLAGVTTSSLVFAVLYSSRSGRYVRAVTPTTGKFTIYLNTTVTSSTYVSWFVVN